MFERLPSATKNIVIINVFMMIITKLRPDFMYPVFALYYPGSPNFEFWQPITHMFMHGGWGHLFFNMFTFVIFGSALERQWGLKKYLFFYFLTGLGAAALHMSVIWGEVLHYQFIVDAGGQDAFAAAAQIQGIKSIPMVGASGAIYGVLMGFAMLYPDTRLTLIFPPVSLAAKWWVVIWVVIELFTGITNAGGGIAHFAHLGGMLFAFLVIRYWKKKGTMYGTFDGYGN